MGPCREEGQIKGCSDLSHFPLPPACMLEGEPEEGTEAGGISSPDGVGLC